MIKDYPENYLKKIIQLKRKSETTENIKSVKDAIQKAYNEVYKAVAFDVDGTLTVADSAEIDSEMSEIIKQLLMKGVHVLLISGRGRGSMKDAVEQIIKKARVPIGYARRLSCIAHNGIYWLRTTTFNINNLLDTEHILVKNRTENLQNIRQEIANLSDYQKYYANGQIVVTEEPSSNPYLLRINYKQQLHHSNINEYRKFCNSIEVIVSKYNKISSVFLSFAKYEKNYLLNISNTNKTNALNFFAKKVGINQQSILRVGDQGHLSGNDYELLNCRSGFTVEKTSEALDCCFPILNSDNNYHLKGVEATRTLLRNVILFPPLTLEPAFQKEQLKALYDFESLATKRARYEVKLFVDKIKIQLHRLLDSKDEFFDIHLFQLSDLFDIHTGGVIIKPFEIFGFENFAACKKLFGISDKIFHEQKSPNLKYSMFTDSSILLRGPFYYWGLTQSVDQLQSKECFKNFTKECVSFIDESLIAINELMIEKPTLLSYKFYLGIIDNYRNIAIHFLFAAYIIESESNLSRPSSKKWMQSKKNQKLVSSICQIMYELLFHETSTWQEMLESNSQKLRNFIKIIQNTSIEANSAAAKPEKGLIRKWREADFFLENVIAINLGLHEFINQQKIKPIKRTAKRKAMIAVGLIYGGIELPFIAQLISKFYSLNISPALINISLYGNKKNREKAFDTDSMEEVRKYENKLDNYIEFEPYSNVTWTEKEILLLDDNCTTCRTLELTRNIFLLQGANVTGAITVKFPSTNRYTQMLFPNHGLPDPDILLSFVRGFISPTPYTRIFKKNENDKNPYLDDTKMFDKAKDRIIRYLKKNGNKTYE